MDWRCGRPVVAIALLALAGCIPAGHPPAGYGVPGYAPAPDDRASREGRRRRQQPPARPAEGGPAGITPPPASVAQSTPGWVAHKVTPDARTVPEGSYTVRPGDTLRSIGSRTGAGSEAIARANGMAAPFIVRPGQRLRIPGGRYHLVHEGDTGVAIAEAYGIPWSDIATANNLQPPYILRTGERLLLPGTGGQSTKETLEQRAQAFNINIDDLITGSEPAIAEHARPKRASETPGRPLPPNVAVAEPRSFSGRFIWPLDGAILGRFGPTGDGRRNDGVNIAATTGEPVRAAADGVVAYAGSAIAVYGGLILLKHGDGWITAYGHVGRILVTRGQKVKQGEEIAEAGATGSVTRPQLHFEIRNKRTPVDPVRYLPAGR